MKVSYDRNWRPRRRLRMSRWNKKQRFVLHARDTWSISRCQRRQRVEEITHSNIILPWQLESRKSIYHPEYWRNSKRMVSVSSDGNGRSIAGVESRLVKLSEALSESKQYQGSSESSQRIVILKRNVWNSCTWKK